MTRAWVVKKTSSLSERFFSESKGATRISETQNILRLPLLDIARKSVAQDDAGVGGQKNIVTLSERFFSESKGERACLTVDRRSSASRRVILSFFILS